MLAGEQQDGREREVEGHIAGYRQACISKFRTSKFELRS
jgi:hypothetical protein